MAKDLISVIVPVYNVEKYLKRCVESLINQTYNDLEIVIVDDGSTDGSSAICDSYAKKDSRIKVIHKQNGGLADACNTGLKVASGDYIGFVDSDDYVHKDMYKILMEGLKKHGADVAFCGFERIYEDEPCNDEIIDDYTCEILSTDIIYSMWHTFDINVKCNKIIKKEILDKIHYPIGKINEDEYVKPVLYENANKVLFIDKKFYYYQQRDTSITKRKFYPQKMDKLDAINESIKWFKEKNIEKYLNAEVKYYWDYFLDYYKQCMFYGKEDTSEKLKVYKKQFNEIYPLILKCPMLTPKNKVTATLIRISPKLVFNMVRRKR